MLFFLDFVLLTFPHIVVDLLLFMGSCEFSIAITWCKHLLFLCNCKIDALCSECSEGVEAQHHVILEAVCVAILSVLRRN